MILILRLDQRNTKVERRNKKKSWAAKVRNLWTARLRRVKLRKERIILEEPEKVVPEFPSIPGFPEISEVLLPEPSDIF